MLCGLLFWKNEADETLLDVEILAAEGQCLVEPETALDHQLASKQKYGIATHGIVLRCDFLRSQYPNR